MGTEALRERFEFQLAAFVALDPHEAGVLPHTRRVKRRARCSLSSTREAGYTGDLMLVPFRVVLGRAIAMLGVATLALALGCAGLADDIRRARKSYAAAAYEDALTWLEAVERDIPAAERHDQAAWHYLRGMTAYRLGDRRDARHYLALAHVIAGDDGVGLQPEWRRTLAITLTELSNEAPAGAPAEVP